MDAKCCLLYLHKHITWGCSRRAIWESYLDVRAKK